MVSNVTSLTGNGLRDWLVQRVTAVYIGAYTLFIIAYILCHPSMNYSLWAALFDCVAMQIASVLAMFCILLHAWVGLWTVTTDYIKPTVLRISIQMLILLYLTALLIWGLHIFWGA